MPELPFFPRFKMSSANPENIEIFGFINRNYFFVDEPLLDSFLKLSKAKWGKLPKAAETPEDEKLEIIKPYIKQIYGWSEREFDLNKHLLMSNLDLNWLNNTVGLSKKECDVLGIEFKTFKVEKPKFMGQMRLF